MKLTIFLITTIIAFGASSVIPLDFKQATINSYLYGEPNPAWLKYVDENGLLDTSLMSEEDNYPPVAPYFNAEQDVVFYLYTQRQTSRRQVVLENLDSIKSSTFDPSKPTRFVIHGWQNDDTADAIQLIKNAYLKKGDFNVFSVDWGKGANSLDYYTCRYRVDSVAAVVARFIEFIVKNMGVKTSQIQIVGHSLGAHISGLTGKAVKSGRISAIIGLDPALPLFTLGNKGNRLDAGDAEYVEVIHTAGGTLGFDDPIGQVDIYPNYGKTQPGCGLDPTNACAHGRAVEFFAESITTSVGFKAQQCGSFTEIKEKNCKATGKTAILGGEPISKGNPQGNYYLTTNEKQPYARG